MPHYLKETKLIKNINRCEIVKNFTNFACGFGGGFTKFWCIKPGVSASCSHECLIEFTVFCAKKTIDGEQFLKRIQVRNGVCGWFVCRQLTVNER